MEVKPCDPKFTKGILYQIFPSSTTAFVEEPNVNIAQKDDKVTISSFKDATDTFRIKMEPLWFDTRAKIVDIDASFVYNSCPSGICNAKVTTVDNGYNCKKCGFFANCSLQIMLKVRSFFTHTYLHNFYTYIYIIFIHIYKNFRILFNFFSNFVIIS